jgi:ribosomal protein S18 acetylase RimI-like enzyme
VSRREVLRHGAERLRVGLWRGDRSVAYVTPVWDGPPPSGDLVRIALRQLADRGIGEVLTGALSAREQRGFLEAGFEVRDELHLLSHDLDGLPDPLPGIRLRRAWRGDRPKVLAVDAAAFQEFWRLDEDGLDEALDATPSTRFRVVDEDGVVAYAICGRAGPRGYVQRLAVRPDRQRSGVGAGLVLDGLHWMRARRVRRAVVNTQVANHAALGLYLRLGFRLEAGGLAVLGRSVEAAPTGEQRATS